MLGALGEAVFARWAGIDFDCASGRTKTLPDQGLAEVRCSTGHPFLKMREDEAVDPRLADRPWFLVRIPADDDGVRRIAYIEGYVYGREVAGIIRADGLRPRTWGSDDQRPPAYFIPARRLHW